MPRWLAESRHKAATGRSANGHRVLRVVLASASGFAPRIWIFTRAIRGMNDSDFFSVGISAARMNPGQVAPGGNRERRGL